MARNSQATNGKRVHVISRKDGWAVKKEGNSKASKIYSTKSDCRKKRKRDFEGQGCRHPQTRWIHTKMETG